MKKVFSYFSVALLATASLSSCSRSNYAFQPGAGSYHTAQTPSVAKTSESATASLAVSADALQKVLAPTQSAKSTVAATPTRNAAAQPVTAVDLAKAAKPNAAQRVLVSKLIKKTKNHSNAASASEEQASRAGKAGIVAAIGLVLLLIGALGVPVVGLIGLIALIVGLVLLFVALIND